VLIVLGCGNNVQKFIDMENVEEGFGTIMNEREFLDFVNSIIANDGLKA